MDGCPLPYYARGCVSAVRSAALALALALVAPTSLALAQDVRDGDTLPARAGGLIISPAYSGGTDRFGPNWSFFGRESILTDFANIDLKRTIVGDAGGPIDAFLGQQRDTFINPAFSGMESGMFYNGERDNPLDAQGNPKFLYRQSTLGYTQFEATQNSVGVNFSLAYGVTDRLTLAAVLPFASATYKIDAHLRTYRTDGDGNDIPDSYAPLTNRRIKPKNPDGMDPLTCPTGELELTGDGLQELFDDTVTDAYRFSVGDLSRALTSDCLGYVNPFDDTYMGDDGYLHGRASRSYSGFRDLILGAKYQWFHGRHFNLSTLTYIVLPTGEPDDPDDLFDPSFGDGQVDVALLVGATIPLGRFRIGVSAGYEIQFGDTIVRRLNGLTFSEELENQLINGEITEEELYDEHLDDGTSTPIVTAFDKANVERKLGNNIYVYSTFGYQILEWLGVGVTIDFLHHFRDQITDTGQRVRNADIKGEGSIEGDYELRLNPDGTPIRLQTSAEVRQQAAQAAAQSREAAITAIRNGEMREPTAAELAQIDTDAETLRRDTLRSGYAGSAERKAAAYAWHTVRSSIVAGFSIQVNTLGPFLRDQFPLPIIASLGAAVPMAGKNLDAIDSFSLSLTIPFITGEVKDPAEYGYDDDEKPGSGLPWP